MATRVEHSLGVIGIGGLLETSGFGQRAQTHWLPQPTKRLVVAIKPLLRPSAGASASLLGSSLVTVIAPAAVVEPLVLMVVSLIGRGYQACATTGPWTPRVSNKSAGILEVAPRRRREREECLFVNNVPKDVDSASVQQHRRWLEVVANVDNDPDPVIEIEPNQQEMSATAATRNSGELDEDDALQKAV
ncbi:hypothetical protein Z517_09416 [Fonsecaea pedrosoi CBS 271.37]|uniref:Uncharacterized protein n=1 Tax=Fonsecaea pedrosoi CBS 271.37 TaxID=1442368 RepID=A0A0D2ERV0_9EURO|nr:uncharacterized protein Z517_09416 [Fonsecaea pedrosoi CBS 271.37]KIW76972.1 hypothetical protein Z517_09416 [Fonsecaea pedrosoi CBS 271.37]